MGLSLVALFNLGEDIVKWFIDLCTTIVGFEFRNFLGSNGKAVFIVYRTFLKHEGVFASVAADIELAAKWQTLYKEL